jgi:hypothetical protein
MPYAVRNASGEILSLHRHDPGVGELLPADHPHVQAFLGLDALPAKNDFERLDAEFVRVIEDVIDALTSKNVINITDLPETAQAKLFARKSFRDRSTKNALHLFKATDYGDVI